MAASPRLAARPGLPFGRSAVVALAAVGVVSVSLAFIHPLLELLIVTFAPALIALTFARGVRAYYTLNARIATVVSGIAAGCWLIVTADASKNVPAVLIGAAVSFLLMVGLAWVGAFVLDRLLLNRDAWRA